MWHSIKKFLLNNKCFLLQKCYLCADLVPGLVATCRLRQAQPALAAIKLIFLHRLSLVAREHRNKLMGLGFCSPHSITVHRFNTS